MELNHFLETSILCINDIDDIINKKDYYTDTICDKISEVVIFAPVIETEEFKNKLIILGEIFKGIPTYREIARGCSICKEYYIDLKKKE